MHEKAKKKMKKKCMVTFSVKKKKA